MNIEIFKVISRLGHRVSPKLIYFFLIYQIVGTFIVFLMDSGFPLIIVIAGWIILFIIILIKFISTSRIEQREEQKTRHEQRQMMQLVSKIKSYISQDPGFQTSCSSCRYYNNDIQTCKTSVPSWANPFKLNVQDKQTFCLYWYSTNEPEPGPSKFCDF